MSFLSRLFNRGPEIRRALDPVTNLPIPYAGQPVDWKWRTIHILSLVVKWGAIAAYVFAHLPGRYAAIAFAVASASKDVAILLGDYLDNGVKDGSFTPPLD